MAERGRLLGRWWFGRFEARAGADGHYHFRDWLQPKGRGLPASIFAGLAEPSLPLAFFRHGFVPAAMSAALAPVTEQPSTDRDALFWQFPCRTEAAAWGLHADRAQPAGKDDELHVYLGLPWATWIDLLRKAEWQGEARTQVDFQLSLVAVRLGGLRQALAGLGVSLRVHTVCQHVYWQDMLPAWKRLGVTDAWLAHCTEDLAREGVAGMQLHPWSLYAVNLEDPERRTGLEPGKDPAARPLLASFIGAHMPHYLSDIRLRLRDFAGTPGFVVRVNDKWHFEGVVYDCQMRGTPLASGYCVDGSVENYNRVLTDARFALCPVGAGPNTLRLWEALAVGSVPVLLGGAPALPQGGTLAPINWEEIVLRVPDDALPGLPDRLRRMPLEEVRRRQRLGMEAYARVREQRCFGEAMGG